MVQAEFSLYIFLPSAETGLAGFLAAGRRRSEPWNAWMNAFGESSGSITLPRFKVSYSKSLVDALSAVGMSHAFGRLADFGAMSPLADTIGIYIKDVLHKTFMEVNEEGTEAAAVTKVEMALPAPSPPFQMIVDRPFCCAVRDNVTGTLLFLGCIVEPD